MNVAGGMPEGAPTYRILGAIEVVNGPQREFRAPRGRQQIVLGALLLEANRVVSIEHLIDAIWDDDPPPTARTQVQICVSALRTSLTKIGCGEVIVTRVPGYLLLASDEQVDFRVFHRLVDESANLDRAGRLAEAAQVAQRAADLWRGPALSGTTSRILQAKAAQLDEQRLSLRETHLDLRLRLGEHHDLIGTLRALVDEHPLRERLRAWLMLALYRAGRQAEALETYRVGRELLIDQLGLEPSDELRELEGAILGQDPALRLDQSKAVPARPAETEIVTPCQLPADITDFTGRSALIAEIEAPLLDPAGRRGSRVVVLVGKPGSGKSALAVHLAHRLRRHFPDGQLYCDLGGTRAYPASPEDVAGQFLRALGIPGSAIPDTLDERAELFRRLVAGRRLLVVLDDAASERQVQPLLPGGASAVVVTSRARFAGLAGTRPLDVDVFEPDEAIGMLGAAIGERRLAGERVAADALIRMVGRLPLALRIVAARLAARPHWSLAWMLERLSDERRRLDELAHGELVVRASLALTYDGLDPQARQLLRWLSLLDGLSFPPWVAAALLDTDVFPAADLLELLVDAQMLEVAAIDLTGNPRFKLHDLIRLFAREHLEQQEELVERRAAVSRVVGGWLGMADEAHRRIYGGDFTILHGRAPRWDLSQLHVDRALADPLVWLESEHNNLCAAVTLAAEAGLDEACWDLATTLVSLFEARGYFDDWERTHLRALDVVREAGNRRGVAVLMCSLGSLHLTRGQPAAAEQRLRPALDAFVALGDAHGSALALRNLALLAQRRGDADEAVRLYRSALEGFGQAGDPVGQAHVLVHMARIDLDRDQPEAAGRHLEEAEAACRDVGGQRVRMQIRYMQSELMVRRHRFQEAAEVLSGLLEAVRLERDIVGQSRILHQLGLVRIRLGEPDAAHLLLCEALALREQCLDPVGAEETRAVLATLPAPADGQPPARGAARGPLHFAELD
ncbi:MULTISPECIES: BTAD domain-containing putative transcriptional regulator [unclassified Micromonospora]|uniref:AfsR/SARP family transcriptional regulator n=1 Tax=unclassified Micromonospora TaxID=2617518 RepID=UPI003632B28C